MVKQLAVIKDMSLELTLEHTIVLTIRHQRQIKPPLCMARYWGSSDECRCLQRLYVTCTCHLEARLRNVIVNMPPCSAYGICYLSYTPESYKHSRLRTRVIQFRSPRTYLPSVGKSCKLGGWLPN